MVYIERDGSGETYQATLKDANGETVIDGDGFDSVEDAQDFYTRMAAALGGKAEFEVTE